MVNLQLTLSTFHFRIPESAIPMIRVVASVIEQHGKFLICQRPSGKRHGGLWEFPGGKMLDDESPFDAVQRELREELGVEVHAVGEAQYSVSDPGSHYMIDFFPVVIDGAPECREHTALRWVAPDELLAYPLAPSDQEYAAFRLREELHTPPNLLPDQH